MKNTTLILGTIAMLISCTEIENLFPNLDNPDNNEDSRIPVSSLTLDETELLIEEGETYTLSVTVSPSDADQAVHWKSDDESIATVGDEGKITAVSLGTTIIKAEAGEVSASCEVTVNRSVPQEGDYFDEYGINHGKGTEIAGIVWAPVNCGYHRKDFKYGKLYQWGRKYGQGYNGPLNDPQFKEIGTYSDASTPIVQQGPVSLETGQSKENEHYIYSYSSEVSGGDWLDTSNYYLWNAGTESEPIKGEYDPCPDGWRVPTYTELNQLIANYSEVMSFKFQYGCWFTGDKPYSPDAPSIFLPLSGHSLTGGKQYWRGYQGSYWSSSYHEIITNWSKRFFFSSGQSVATVSARSEGASVRCVQDKAKH